MTRFVLAAADLIHAKGLAVGLDCFSPALTWMVGQALETLEPFEKIMFSAVRDEVFMEGLSSLGLTQVIVTGMESHVCVFQTVLDLLARGYLVHVPQDAVCSRTKQNWRTGLLLMERAGAVVTSTETIVFQLLERAGTDAFKAIAPLIK